MLKVWQILLMIFIVNGFIGYIFIVPIKTMLSNSLGNSQFMDRLNDGFDYTALTEILRESSNGLSSLPSLFVGLALLYFVWNIFTAAGLLGIVSPITKNGLWPKFFHAGSTYFFKVLLITVLTVVLLLIAIVFMLIIFQALGINLLHMDSEMGLIRNIKIALVFLLIWRFFLGIFRDACKLYILNNTQQTSMIRGSWNHLFSLRNITLAFINVFFLIFVLVALFMLRSSFGELVVFVTIGIFGQLLVLARVLYRFVRINSFYRINNTPRAHFT